MLDVEDPDDILHVAPADVSAGKAHRQRKQQCRIFTSCNLIAEMDLAFIIYCFFEDLRMIQDFLKETRKRYKASEVDLMAPKMLSKPEAYQAISSVIFLPSLSARVEAQL